MGCRAWVSFLPRFPVNFFPAGFFSAGFFWPPSNHDVLLVVAQLSLFFLAGNLEECLALYGFMWLLDYLFSVLWCSAKTCKINLMVHYVLCLLRSEAEMSNENDGIT